MTSRRLTGRSESKSALCRLPQILQAIAWCLSISLLASARPAETADAQPLLSYTRVLQGSIPEYLAVTVHADGSGTYEGRKLDDPPNPSPFKLSAATTDRLFQLAGELNDFRSLELESHKKVANLGLKTFIYENGTERNRVQFNYTMRREAQDLADIFEKIAGVEQHIQHLEYSLKYDPLGLPTELLQIQIDLDNKALADPELMVPRLEAIARDPRLLHLAQVRAQEILARIQKNN